MHTTPVRIQKRSPTVMTPPRDPIDCPNLRGAGIGGSVRRNGGMASRLPRKNDPSSIAARRELLGLDGESDLSAYTKAAESLTGTAVIPVSVAELHVSLGEYERALAESTKATEMQPNDSVAQCQVGQAFFRLKKYEDALQHLELARRLDPMSDTLPGLYIAQIYEARGDKTRALAEYKELLTMHPGHAYVGSIQNEIMFLEKQTGK